MKIFISVYPFGIASEEPKKILESLGLEISYNTLKRKLTPREVATMAKDYDIIIAGTENLDLLLNENSKLKMISRVGIGLDSVPLSLCKDRNIQVGFTPDAVTEAVVEQTIGAMITTSRFMIQSHCDIQNQKWVRYIGRSISESTIGIIGFGRVGLGVVKILAAFPPKEIIINDILNKEDVLHPLRNQYPHLNIRQSSKEDIYTKSNIISLHVPLTKQTKNMVTLDTFQLCLKDTYWINYSRGGIINEQDLYTALLQKDIAMAAIDVFEKEPYTGNLTQLDNILLTAHIGSCTYKSRIQMELESVQNVALFLKNQPLLNNALLEHYLFE